MVSWFISLTSLIPNRDIDILQYCFTRDHLLHQQYWVTTSVDTHEWFGLIKAGHHKKRYKPSDKQQKQYQVYLWYMYLPLNDRSCLFPLPFVYYICFVFLNTSSTWSPHIYSSLLTLVWRYIVTTTIFSFKDRKSVV